MIQDTSYILHELNKPAATGITTSEVTGTTQAIVKNYRYIANNAAQVVFTLPATAAIGDTFMIYGKGAGGWAIHSNASASAQTIYFGYLSSDTSSSSAILLSFSQYRYDCVEITCITADADFVINDYAGSPSIGLYYPVGLYTHWKLDEGSGQAIDAKGNYNLGEIGTVPSDTGKLDGARGQFTASNYFRSADATNTTPFDVTAFAVEGWFKTNSGATQFIFSKGNTSETTGWAVYLNSTGYLYFASNDGSARNLISPSTYNDGNWHYFFCMTMGTGATDKRMYIDGSNVINGQGYTNTLESVYLYCGFTNIASLPFLGLLDDLAFWDDLSIGKVAIEAIITQRWNAGAGKRY